MADAVRFNQLRYPYEQIEPDTDYLKIDIFKYVPLNFDSNSNVLREGLKRSKGSYKGKEAISSIILPVPQNISSTNATGWGEDSINTLAAYGLSKIPNIINAPDIGSFFSNLFNAVGDAGTDFANAAGSGMGKKAANAYFSSLAVNALGANTSFEGVLARSTGSILNPNTELLFNGVKLRSFNFSFDLAPRNREEAIQIKNIIRTFKINMAPIRDGASSGAGGLFLKTPNVFQLSYKTGNQNHKFLNSFIIAALTNINVNYTGSGTYMTYDDNSKTPVHMKMDLSFQELSPIYQSDYEDEKGSNGVGY
jgi:hypothetical protein